ncbi:MAG: PDZ domain-containing protein, partial [Bacteroidia bacterium]|nr:PDZ domain-containing protein [Bacteroidia bacterium]
SNLPTLPFVNSDDVKVGEWVLAVGNPFSLNSTVTAGIISAKARNINILREQFAVESFIQTDAAINPGNSGGALVNLDGRLVGINTAIQTRTGTYNGYGFAVPSNIVSKVIEDLIEFGTVQRGVLGVMIRSIDGRLAEEKDLDMTEGIFVDSLLENSAAGEAGIRPGDVIIKVNDMEVKSSPELQEIIARYRPGDKVKLGIIRKSRNLDIDVTLGNLNRSISAVSNEHKGMLNKLGIAVDEVDSKLADRLKIRSGIRITNIYSGRISRETKIREGFIVTHIDSKSVSSVKDFLNTLAAKKGGVMLEGLYEDIPGKHYYAIGMDG